jgi:hypothetical protein
LFAVAPHNKPQRGELAMTLADLDNLARIDEVALDPWPTGPPDPSSP